MPKVKTSFEQAITVLNDYSFDILHSDSTCTIIKRIDRVLCMAPTQILQELDKTTFDDEFAQNSKTLNDTDTQTEVAIEIFKKFIQFSEEEQMTIQKFLYCPCFHQIVKFMFPEKQIEACKHINKFIQTITDTTCAALTRKFKKQYQHILDQTLKTYNATESVQKLKYNAMWQNAQILIQKIKKYASIDIATQNNTQEISETIQQIQQELATSIQSTSELIMNAMLYEVLDLDTKPTTMSAAIHYEYSSRRCQKAQTKTIDIAETEKIAEQETEEIIKIAEEEPAQRTTETKNKYQISSLIEAAEAKNKYQILSLIYDTPHNKELKEQYAKDNPEITQHELYPILEIIHNYIYEEKDQQKKQKKAKEDTQHTENEAKQEKAQSKIIKSTTKQQKKQIFVLSFLHNKIPVGENQLTEVHAHIDEIQICARKSTTYEFQYLKRIVKNTQLPAWNNNYGSAIIKEFVIIYETYGDNPTKLSQKLQCIYDLLNAIQSTEKTKKKNIPKVTQLETSQLTIAGLYINYYNKQTILNFLRNAKITPAKTEEEAKSLIKELISKTQIKEENALLPAPVILIHKPRIAEAYDTKQNTIQEIFAYIQEPKSCYTGTTQDVLSKKQLTTQFKKSKPKPLYTYHSGFTGNPANKPKTEAKTSLLLTNTVGLALLETPEEIPQYRTPKKTNANIAVTQQKLNQIIHSLINIQEISCISIIKLYNEILETQIKFVTQNNTLNPRKTMQDAEHSKIYKTKYANQIPRIYKPIIQKIAANQDKCLLENNTKTPTTSAKHKPSQSNQSEETQPAAKIQKTQHNATPCQIFKHSNQPEETQPAAKIQKTQHNATLKYFLNTTQKTSRKNTNQQKPPTLLTETHSAQKDKTTSNHR